MKCDLQQIGPRKWWCPVCDPHKKRLLRRKALRRCGGPECLPQLVRTFLEQHDIPKDTVETWYKAAGSCEESRKRRAQLNKWAIAVLKGELAEPKAELEKLIAI